MAQDKTLWGLRRWLAQLHPDRAAGLATPCRMPRVAMATLTGFPAWRPSENNSEACFILCPTWEPFKPPDSF